LEGYEESRINKLQAHSSVPPRYRKSFCAAEERRQRAKEIQRMKAEKQMKIHQVYIIIIGHRRFHWAPDAMKGGGGGGEGGE
jgi:hypothetical protein